MTSVYQNKSRDASKKWVEDKKICAMGRGGKIGWIVG